MYRNTLPSDCQQHAPSGLDWRLGLAVLLSLLVHLLLSWLLLRPAEDGATAAVPPQTMEVSLVNLPAAKPEPSPSPKPPEPEPAKPPAAKPKPMPLPPPIPRPKPVEWPKLPTPPKPPKQEHLPPPPPKPAPPKPKPPKPLEPAKPKPPKPKPLPPPEPEPPEPTPEPPAPEEPPPPRPVPKPEPEPEPEPEPVRPEPEPEMESEPTEAEPPPKPPAKPPRAQRQKAAKPTKPAKAEALPEFKDDFAQLSTDYSAEPKDSLAKGKPQAPALGVQTGAILNINPRVYYPRNAMNKGMRGVVVVLIHISAEGRATDVELLHSSGYEELDNQVLGAVQHWRFRPPMRGNTPVESTFKHSVIFGADQEVTDDFTRHWREIQLEPATP